MAFQSVRGFKDVLPPDSERLARLEAVARDLLGRFGYREIRLPTLEARELFVKATGETTDIVEKEMFLLQDAGGRELALRPEGTPGVVRAFLQHHLHQQGGRVKLYYVGSMFRAERPQAGRFREFEQIGAECFGNAHPAADAEVISALALLLDEAGLSGKYSVHINNLGDESPDCRPAYRARLLDYLRTIRGELCEHCQSRIDRNPLRVLDCKGDGPRLKARGDLPLLAPCKACSEHFDAVATRMLRGSIPRIELDSSLVRGLDYYTRTVFEFKSQALGAQDAVAGGGRYDGLVQSMGGPAAPAVGWALGVERTLLALAAVETPAEGRRTEVYVALQSEASEAAREAVDILYALRKEKIPSDGGLFGHSLKSQLREADRLGARFAVILGEEEFKKGECLLKDLRGNTAARSGAKPDNGQRSVPLETAVAEVLRALRSRS